MKLEDYLIDLSVNASELGKNKVIGKIADKVLDIYYFFRGKYSDLCRTLYWAKVGYEIKDYCADYSLILINHQLKRFNKYIKECGHLEWHINPEDEDYKGFNELLDLSNRVLLHEHPEIEALYDAHREKWGELIVEYTPSERGDGFFNYSSRYANAKTDEDRKQSNREFSEIFMKERQHKQLLLETFCDKMKKIEHYWD